MVDLDVPPLLIIVCILLAYAVLGMFMDAIGMLVLTLPVVYPAVVPLGYDPIWFGIVVVKMAVICLITHPSASLLRGRGVARELRGDEGQSLAIPLQDVFRGIGRSHRRRVAVAVLLAVPEVVLWLPKTMG